MSELNIVDVVKHLRERIESAYPEDSAEVQLLHTLIRSFVRMQKKYHELQASTGVDAEQQQDGGEGMAVQSAEATVAQGPVANELLEWCKDNSDFQVSLRARSYGYNVVVNRSGTVHQHVIKYRPEEDAPLSELLDQATKEVERKKESTRTGLKPVTGPSSPAAPKVVAPKTTPKPQASPRNNYPPELQELINKIEAQKGQG